MKDLFNTEEKNILHAEGIIAKASESDSPLVSEYTDLLSNYKKLYKQLIRLIKINDKQASKLNAENIVLEQHSKFDGLTGILNRRSFNEGLSVEWAKSIKYQTCLTLLMIDIDNFKSFNDTYGHQTGDNILVQAALQIQNRARRSGDMAARYGGEEFVLMLPGLEKINAQKIAEALRTDIEELNYHYKGDYIKITISIGISTMEPGKMVNSDILINRADKALYLAKSTGRNRVCTYEEVVNTGE